MIRIFIGFDPRETVAFSVLAHSIVRRSSKPVSIVPIVLSHLSNVLTRERHALQSTDFSFSRFLTPYLCDYQGWSLFMDCDMLMLADGAGLWDRRDARYAVQVIKHEHKPRESTKFLGAQQTTYEKKNWSSVMLFNNALCKRLSPDYVNSASGLELHQFKWLENDSLIGDLPRQWNHLVGYDPPDKSAALVHFTIGGPYFSPYADCEFSSEWRAERDAMLFAGER
ncbi:MAG: glycosyltransferase [Burkholderiales bacterium]